jgi:hypothetical protein
MPITVPPFVQYQAPLYPLRGLWNSAPVEGDRFVSAEIDWGVTTQAANAVQFSLSGNSPVAISQIVAFAVDNSACAVDVQYLFPDSGSTLNVPAYSQGIYPVYTNALMFYATANGAAVGDRTVFQVLNSMPPPVAIEPTQEMTQAVATGIGLVNGSTVLIPVPVNGTVQAYDISVNATVAGACSLALQDGQGHVLWDRNFDFTINSSFDSALSGLRLRFYNGLNLLVQNSTFGVGQGAVSPNVYYALP